MKESEKSRITLVVVVFFLIGSLVLSFSAGSQSGEPGSTQPVPPQAASPQAAAEQQAGTMVEERRAMVANQIEARGVEDTEVCAAMRRVPRHEFVAAPQRGQAYSDKPLPIGQGQTISQPYIVAYMTEVLQLDAGEKVLEIGTGSGYQAAVLAEITDRVYTIEIIVELAEEASARLQRLGYAEVQATQGDGYYGWEEHTPFDAIIVTAAAGHIPPPLLRQLKPGGRMVIPIGGVYEVQSLMLVRKTTDGEVRTERLMPVRFVPFRGEAQKRSGG